MQNSNKVGGNKQLHGLIEVNNKRIAAVGLQNNNASGQLAKASKWA